MRLHRHRSGPLEHPPTFMLVLPEYPEGASPEDRRASIAAVAEGRASGAAPDGSVAGVRFVRATDAFAMNEVTLADGASPRLRALSFGAGPSIPPAFDGVAQTADAAADAAVAGAARYLLVPADGGPFLGAVDAAMVAERGGEILRGVAYPTPVERAAFLEAEKGRGLLARAGDLYFNPKGFERSGRLYRAMGIRGFKWLVMKGIMAPLKFIAGKFAGWVGKIAGDASTEEVMQDVLAKPTPYTVGARRRLEDLAEFEAYTRKNEKPHAVVAFGALPIIVKLVLVLGMSASFAEIAVLYVLNAYATALQRYNRARIFNTIDLKLGRGRYAPAAPIAPPPASGDMPRNGRTPNGPATIGGIVDISGDSPSEAAVANPNGESTTNMIGLPSIVAGTSSFSFAAPVVGVAPLVRPSNLLR